MPLAPRRRSLTALAALSITTFAAAHATSAQAGSLEQITRASGAQGWSPFHANDVSPLFVSDTGRFAIYHYYPHPGPPSGGTIFVRNIVTNTTTPLGDATVRKFFGVDKAEQRALVERYDEAANKTTLALLPLAGGAPTVLYTWNTSVDLQAAISGDGKTVAVSSLNDGTVTGLYKLTVATKAVQQIDTRRVGLSQRSLSDDGQVVAGYLPGTFKGIYFHGATKTETPRNTLVSPNGAVVASVFFDESGYKLATRTLATGTTKTFSLPDGVWDVQWVSADGRYFATPWSINTDPATPTKVLDTANGTWTTLAGPYSGAVNGSILGVNDDSARSLVSRNGRYAVAPITQFTPWQLGLLDLSGGDLPGEQEPLATTAYVEISPPYVTCAAGEASSITVSFSQGRPWIGKPKRATVRISADGAEIFNETLTTPATLGAAGDRRTVQVPKTTKSLFYDVKVVDADNRTISGTSTEKPRYFCLP